MHFICNIVLVSIIIDVGDGTNHTEIAEEFQIYFSSTTASDGWGGVGIVVAVFRNFNIWTNIYTLEQFRVYPKGN